MAAQLNFESLTNGPFYAIPPRVVGDRTIRKFLFDNTTIGDQSLSQVVDMAAEAIIRFIEDNQTLVPVYEGDPNDILPKKPYLVVNGRAVCFSDRRYSPNAISPSCIDRYFSGEFIRNPIRCTQDHFLEKAYAIKWGAANNGKCPVTERGSVHDLGGFNIDQELKNSIQRFQNDQVVEEEHAVRRNNFIMQNALIHHLSLLFNEHGKQEELMRKTAHDLQLVQQHRNRIECLSGSAIALVVFIIRVIGVEKLSKPLSLKLGWDQVVVSTALVGIIGGGRAAYSVLNGRLFLAIVELFSAGSYIFPTNGLIPLDRLVTSLPDTIRFSNEFFQVVKALPALVFDVGASFYDLHILRNTKIELPGEVPIPERQLHAVFNFTVSAKQAHPTKCEFDRVARRLRYLLHPDQISQNAELGQNLGDTREIYENASRRLDQAILWYKKFRKWD